MNGSGKVSGPAIVNAASAKTVVKIIKAGLSFELTVKDNGGLPAKDMLQVVVKGGFCGK